MRTSVFLLLGSLLTLSAPAKPAAKPVLVRKPAVKAIVAERPPPIPRPQGTTGLLVVKLKGNQTAAERVKIAAALGGRVVKVMGALSLMLVEPIPGAQVATGATKHPAIEYIESETMLEAQGVCVGEAPAPHFRLGGLPSPFWSYLTGLLDIPGTRELFRPDDDAVATDLGPNDPYFRYQWGLQSYPYGVGVVAASRRAQGQGVTVAVIDTGIREDLADLRGTRFVPGRNLLTNTANATDDNGHGSHVAGTIAQATNNGIGCSGIAPKAALMPVKVLGKDGRGSNFAIAQGIIWATDHGAQVLNMSLGGASSRTLQDAVRYAYQKGVAIIAAAGNGGGQGLIFPAGYSEVISVGAIDQNGMRASFSQWGAGLSLTGPGVKILQQTINKDTGQPGYYYFNGTSMACPHVCGSAALIKGLVPTLTPGQLRQRLQTTAHDLGARGTDSYYGAGAVDAAAAVQMQGSPGQPTPPADEPLPFPPDRPQPIPEPGPGPAPDPGPDPGPVPPATDASALLPMINEERAKAGVPPVTIEARLNQAALTHAKDMAEHGNLSHTGSDGSDPGTRITKTGYPWKTYGETIAAGQKTAAAVHAAWMNSPPHKAIILHGKYREVGLASFQKEGTSTRYWVQVFSSR